MEEPRTADRAEEVVLKPCPNCGTHLEKGVNYCPECGAALTVVDGEAETSPLPDQWYYLAFAGMLAVLTGAFIVTPFSGTVEAGATLVVWLGYAALLVGAIVDVKTVGKRLDWDVSWKVLGIGLIIPYLNILIGLWYLYARHRRVSAEKRGWFSHSAYLVAGATTAALSVVFWPILLGPLSIASGVQIRRHYSRSQGTALATIGAIAMVVGFIGGVAAT